MATKYQKWTKVDKNSKIREVGVAEIWKMINVRNRENIEECIQKEKSHQADLHLKHGVKK